MLHVRGATIGGTVSSSSPGRSRASRGTARVQASLPPCGPPAPGKPAPDKPLSSSAAVAPPRCHKVCAAELFGKTPSHEISFHPSKSFEIDAAAIINEQRTVENALVTGHFRPSIADDIDIMVQADHKGLAALRGSHAHRCSVDAEICGTVRIDRDGAGATFEIERRTPRTDLALTVAVDTKTKPVVRGHFASRHDNALLRLHADFRVDGARVTGKGDWRVGGVGKCWQGHFEFDRDLFEKRAADDTTTS